MSNKFNAVKHGAMSRSLMPNEKRISRRVYESLVDEYKPTTFTENMLVETMAMSYLRRQRALWAERELFLSITDPEITEERIKIADGTEFPAKDPFMLYRPFTVIVRAGHKPKITDEQVERADQIYARYITTCERQYFRALHELQRLRHTISDGSAAGEME